MRGKAGGITLLSVGIILIVAGLVVKFAVVPSMAQLPDDVDSTRTYAGTMNQMLNAQALATGDLANLFVNDVPVDITRHVFVESTDGEAAIVVEEATATLADGTTIADTTDVYAIDRKSMEHITDYGDDQRVLSREGLAIGWPIGTEQRDYVGWSSDLQRPVDVTFEGTEEHAGLETYVFRTDISPSPIADPDLLAQFPQTIPKALLAQLAGQMELPENLVQAFQQLLPTLPDDVPITYLFSGETTYWIEPTSGVVIDIDRAETRQAALVTDAVPMPVPLTEVFDWTYQATDSSVDDAVADAEDAMGQLSMFGTILPYSAIALGVLLLVAGAFLLRRRGSGNPEGPGSPTVADDRTPAGMS